MGGIIKAITSIFSVISGLGPFGSFLFNFAASLILGIVSSALLKPKKAKTPLSSFSTLIRVSAEPHRIVQGERRVSGPLVFVTTTEINNRMLHMVIALAGHEVEAIGDVFLNEERITQDQIDAQGVVIDGRFQKKDGKEFVRIRKFLGTDDQLADPDLVSETTEWTDAHRLRGIAYLYLRLRFDRSNKVFPTGIPNVSAIVKGRKILDPRTGQTAWTNNAALCLFDYLRSSFGLEADADEIDIDAVIKAANLCDQDVALPTQMPGFEFTADPATDQLSQVVPPTSSVTALVVGDAVTLSSTGTLPAPLVAGVRYFVADPTPSGGGFKLSGSLADADKKNPIVIDITDAGTGTHTLTRQLFSFGVSANGATDVLTQEVASAAAPRPIHLGDGISFATDGTLPTPLTAGTRYYAVPVGEKDFKVATTLANARAGVAVDLTSAGIGSHVATRESQPRYTTNAVYGLDQRPIDIVEDLLTPMAGTLVYPQGRYFMLAGAWRGPARLRLTEGDLRGSLKFQPRPSRRDLHNGVRGTFLNRDGNDQITDFPPVTNASWEAEDGGPITKDVQFPFVGDVYAAQRLAKLVNERERRAGVMTFPAKLDALDLSVGRIVALKLAGFGFDDKPFELISWSLAEEGGVDLLLQETDAAVFDFDPDQDLTIVEAPPVTNLPDAGEPPALVTGLGLASETMITAEPPMGLDTAAIVVSWGLPTDIAETGSIEVEFKPSSSATWLKAATVTANVTQILIGEVASGESYDVRATAVNRFGVRSDPSAPVTIQLPGDWSDDFGSVAIEATRTVDFGSLVEAPKYPPLDLGSVA